MVMPEREDRIIGVDVGIFDECEIHTNCTVEIWRNSVTGEFSIGWWENDRPPVREEKYNDETD